MGTFPRNRVSALACATQYQDGRMVGGDGEMDRGMTRRVEGKVALVTGAAHGIGRGAAMVLAREGAKLIATDLQDEKGEALLRELRAAGCEAEDYHHDVSSEEEWQSG